MKPWEEYQAQPEESGPWAEYQGPWSDYSQEPAAPREPRTANEIRSAMLRDVLDAATEFGLETINSAVQVGEALNPISQALKLAGMDGADIPNLTELAREYDLLLPRGETHTGGWLGEVASAAGAVPYAAGSVVQVPRNVASSSSLLKDFLGAGMTAADDWVLQGERTARALATANGMDNTFLGKMILEDPDEIYEAARMVAKRDIIGKNKPFMEQMEAEIKHIMKDIDDAGTKISDVDWPQGAGASLSRVLKEMKETHGVDPQTTLRVLKSKGGIKFDEDAVALEAGSRMLDANRGNAITSFAKEKEWKQMVDHAIYPVADVFRKYVSPLVGGKYERAIETSTRRWSALMDDLGKPHERLYRMANKMGIDRESIYARNLKRALMDLHKDPDRNLRLARWNVQQVLGDDGVKMFDDWLFKSEEFGADIRQHVLRQDQDLDKYFIHFEKLSDQPKPGWGVSGSAYSKTGSAMKRRTRDTAWEMSDEEIDLYDNPFVTHLKYLQEYDPMAQISKRFGMRPPLKAAGMGGKGGEGSSNKFFKEFQKTLIREGFDKNTAKAAADLGHNVNLGMQRNMGKVANAWMSGVYAGTLGNPISAALNYHDPFVAAVNMGWKNVLKGIIGTNKGMWGKSLDAMGISRAQSTGEFLQQFDRHFSDPQGFDKMSRWVDNLATTQFKFAGFTAADRHNKSIVLRTAMHWMKDNARKGNLYREMKDMASPYELQKIRPYLKSDMKFTEMPAEVQDLIEELAFVKLGEQQLISIAGRPAAYITGTLRRGSSEGGAPSILRPMYALTGFAIKQQAMVRKAVLQKMKEHPGQAGIWAARYALYAGMGYGFLDSGPRAVMRDQEVDSPEDFFLGALEQVGAVATLNRLGSSYDTQRFFEDPVLFILESMLPPTGYQGAVVKDTIDLARHLLTGGKTDFTPAEMKTLEKLPILGTAIRYGWIDIGQEVAPSAQESKQDKWDKVLKQVES